MSSVVLAAEPLDRVGVLVVEDDAPSARLLRLVLRSAGADVRVATTAVEATRALDAGFVPSIVLLDLDLPDRFGVDLARELRGREALQDVPIVVVSASAIAFGERAALSAGCDAFIRKPIDTGSFAARIAEIYRRPRSVALRAIAAPTALPSLSGHHAAILDALPKGVCVVRPSDLVVVHANRAFERFAGAPVHEVVGHAIAVSSADGAGGSIALRDALGRQLDAGGQGTVEVPRTDEVGRTEWFQITASRFVADPEVGELWLMVVDDVTQRRNADDALQRALVRSEARFSTLSQSGVLAIATGEIGGRLIDANDQFLALIGRTRAELGQHRIFSADFNDPGARANDEIARAQLRARGVASPYEKDYLRPDGSRVPVLVGGALIDETTYVSYAIDLTERRRDQQRLRESQRRFDALWRSGMLGVAIGDNVGGMSEANDAYLAMVGYDRADLETGRMNYIGIVPPEQHDVLARAVAEVQARGFAEPFETEAICKDGSRVPMLVGVAAIDEHHNVALVTDLSARKRAEERLRRAEEQLRHAQKMDESGRLAGGIAHDFNNLLSVILSYSEILHEEAREGDPSRDDLDEIRKAARRASALTRQLLIFSRQEVTEARVVDPNEAIVAVDRMLQRILGEHVELVALPGAEIGRVRVDPSHLEQVIVNLAVNARDAMPVGGKLTIETRNVELDAEYAAEHVTAKPGRYVMVAVTDTGCGMDAATQSRIFDPFFTTKPVGKGTGLGLSIVFGIVQQAGGHVWVYSEVGQGTTFKLYFPRVDAAADTVRPAAKPTTLRGSETVLLVEDEEAVRRVALGILQRHGYHVLEARGPGEALLLAERHAGEIDLLLTDVVMPQMSGPALARRLVAMRPQLRVLCMSGYTDDAVVRHGMVDDGVAFLQKPLTPDSLARKVRGVLDAEPRP